jgi:hypothetical protein
MMKWMRYYCRKVQLYADQLRRAVEDIALVSHEQVIWTSWDCLQAQVVLVTEVRQYAFLT